MLKLVPCIALLFTCFYGISQPADAYINKLAGRFMQNSQHVGLSIGVIQAGVPHTYHYGSVSKNKRSLPAGSTIYEIGSVTKTFTGLLLAHAIKEHKISMQDDIRKYLDAAYTHWISDTAPAKIIHLANHTSGLPKNVPAFKDGQTPTQLVDAFNGFSEDDFLQQLALVKTTSAPGSHYSYSNAGVQLLGIILEKVYQQPYGALLEKYITVPYGMNDTRLTVKPANTTRMATGYDSAGNIMPQADMWKAIPQAGYLKSTTADLLKYLQLNMNVKNDTIQLTQQATFYHTDEDGDGIGLYWFIHRQPGSYAYISHAGGTFGCTSYCLLAPKFNIGIVCLANDAAPGTERALKALAGTIIKSLIHKKVPTHN